MDEHLGYESYERSDNDNYRNGTKKRLFVAIMVNSKQMFLKTDKVALNLKSLKNVKKISPAQINRLSACMPEDLPQDKFPNKWRKYTVLNAVKVSSPMSQIKYCSKQKTGKDRPLDEVYPVMFIDAVHFSVREDNLIKKLAAYVVLAITMDGQKDVISLQIGENESSKFWLSVLNDLKNRGVKDVMVICADGLTGIKEAIAAAFPEAEYQRCIVHQVRNTLKYVSYKDKKAFATDLKAIYLAPNENQGYENMQIAKDRWDNKYPHAMKSWDQNWDVLTPIFKFSTDVRKVIYTTNAIESLNSTYKKLNRPRTVFPSDKTLLKPLYLSTLQATKKWTQPLRSWAKVYGEFSIMYGDRFKSINS